MTTIDEKTKFPLSLIIAVGGSFIGLCVFLTTMFVQGVANSKDIDTLKTDIKEDNKVEMQLLKDIHERVIRIEEKIKK